MKKQSNHLLLFLLVWLYLERFQDMGMEDIRHHSQPRDSIDVPQPPGSSTLLESSLGDSELCSR